MALNTALSGLQAASNQLSVLGNNIANASTPGFKSQRAEFRDVVAAGALGASANIIGSGVQLAAVTQEFTQGNILQADTNLDLAINGSGFFILDSNGSRLYSRSGGFSVDNNGNISNSQQQQLIGFLSDQNNNITSAQGPLQIQNTTVNPSATENATIGVNLDVNETLPTGGLFATGFTAANFPKGTFNKSTDVQIYDSLGKEHMMTLFFVKAPALRTWNVYVGIDNNDVTPTAAPVPNPGTANASNPSIYPSNAPLAKPFTIVFNDDGSFIPNNTASPPKFYGYPPVTSTDNSTVLVQAGSLPTLANQDLTINGVQISMGTPSDNISPVADRAGSMISICAAINAQTSAHNVRASVNPNVFQFTAGNYTTDALTAGNLSINGVNIVGSPQGASATLRAASLATMINNASIPEITASTYVDGNGVTQVQLTAQDGRNIQVSTNGTATSLTFGNVDLTDLNTHNLVKRSQLSLTITPSTQAITIGGNNPNNASLLPGTRSGIFQDNSDAMTISFNPGSGATSPQIININLGGTSNPCTLLSSPYAIKAINQDGYQCGNLNNVQVSPKGIITANYDNGVSQQLGQVALANFSNPTGLQAVGETSWIATYASGVALLGAPNTSNLGTIVSGALEDSNVQLTDELVGLITAQRNFQASAQSIRTEDAITQTIINIR
jgi:flagellar hook protein FlgE